MYIFSFIVRGFCPYFLKMSLNFTAYTSIIHCVLKNKYIIVLKVIPCFQRDGLFCLHENGCITLRVRRSYNSTVTTSNEEPGRFRSYNDANYISSELFCKTFCGKCQPKHCLKKVLEYGYNVRCKNFSTSPV